MAVVRENCRNSGKPAIMEKNVGVPVFQVPHISLLFIVPSAVVTINRDLEMKRTMEVFILDYDRNQSHATANYPCVRAQPVCYMYGQSMRHR